MSLRGSCQSGFRPLRIPTTIVRRAKPSRVGWTYHPPSLEGGSVVPWYYVRSAGTDRLSRAPFAAAYGTEHRPHMADADGATREWSLAGPTPLLAPDPQYSLFDRLDAQRVWFGFGIVETHADDVSSDGSPIVRPSRHHPPVVGGWHELLKLPVFFDLESGPRPGWKEVEVPRSVNLYFVCVFLVRV